MATVMQYNTIASGNVDGLSGVGGGMVVSDGPQNKKICTGVQQENGGGADMYIRVVQSQQQQRGLLNRSNDNLRRKRPENIRPNHVLLFTVINPFYPITVDILHKICHPYGQVLRIVIFKKNGVQAMIEFDSLDAATRARENLNGADIYSGCCTLKIDYAIPEKLNVYRNELETSWDYTLPSTGLIEIHNSRSPLLQEPIFPTQSYIGFIQPTNFGQYKESPLLASGTVAYSPVATSDLHGTTPVAAKDAIIHSTGLIKDPVVYTSSGQNQSGVMMVYGLNNEMLNTDKLFNLVCLYGNVARIKFLKTKEGTAMVQMGDSVAVKRCIQHLNNIPIGNTGKIQIAFSKQNVLSKVINPFLLPDHTPSFKEYTDSKYNRFLSSVQASKNRIQSPSKILHFFNTPPGLTEDQLMEIFTIRAVPAISVCLFPLRSDRSSSGLIEFPDIGHSVLSIMMCNHLPIEAKGTKFPYIMKLCFSSSTSMNGAWNNVVKQDEYLS